MPSITIHVPAPLVEAVHETLLAYRDVKLEFLGSRPVSDRGDGQEQAVQAVGSLDRVIASVDWDDRSPDASIDMVAESDLLAEIVHGVLLAEVDRLAAECQVGSPADFDQAKATHRLRQVDYLIILHGVARG